MSTQNPGPILISGLPEGILAVDSKFEIQNDDGLSYFVEMTDLSTFIGSISSPLTSKGDLYGFDTGDARIPVGIDGYVLTADSSEDVGVSWQTPLASEWSKITAVSDVNFGNFSILNAAITASNNTISGLLLGTEVTGASTNLTDSANLARNSDNLSFFSTTTSEQLLTLISDETGTGSLVFGTTPTLGTPVIGSFASATHDHSDSANGGKLTATDALTTSGTANSTTFLRGDNAWSTALTAAITSLGGDTAATQTLTGGTGIVITNSSPDHSFSIDSTVATSGNNLGFFATTTSAQLSGVISDETGTGVLVFGTSPTLITPVIGSFASAGHDHSDATNGGQFASTNLSDSADLARINASNSWSIDQIFPGIQFTELTGTITETAVSANFSGYIVGVTDNTTQVTITILSADIVNGRIFIIKDQAGTAASANSIKIVGETSELIDGTSELLIQANYGSVRLYAQGDALYSI